MALKDEFARALRNIKDKVGDDGIDKLAEVLEEKGDEADKGWQKAAVRALADAVRRKGPDGLDFAMEQIENALKGDDADFSFTSLRAGSELLAALQNAEADKRERIKGFVQAAFEVIKAAIKAVI